MTEIFSQSSVRAWLFVIVFLFPFLQIIAWVLEFENK
jgi:hypothetical protein